MDMLCSESEDYQKKHRLGYSTARNFVGTAFFPSLSPFDNSESADDSFFYDPSSHAPGSPAPAVRPKSKSIDRCIDGGNDLDCRVIASLKDECA